MLLNNGAWKTAGSYSSSEAQEDIFTAAVCTCCAHIMNIHTAMLSPMITINLYNDSFFCERNEERLLSVNEP